MIKPHLFAAISFAVGSLFIVPSVAGAESPEFTLVLTNHNETGTLYLPQTVSYELKYEGPDRRMSVGVKKWSFVFLVQFQDSDEQKWYDRTTPQVQPEPPRERLFQNGDTFKGTEELFWQPSLRVFDQAGIWKVRVKWFGANGEAIYSNPVSIRIEEPSNEDRKVLDLLKERNALPALSPVFCKRERFQDRLSEWRNAYKVLAKRYPENKYVLALGECLSGSGDTDGR